MPLYEVPRLGDFFSKRYIRIHGIVYIGVNEEMDHSQLAELERLKDAISQLRETNRSALDLGLYTVSSENIILDEGSSTLGLPINAQARQESVVIFQQQSPGFNVRAGWQ